MNTHRSAERRDARHGRDCGTTRPPLDGLDAKAYEKLAAEMNGMSFLKDEPRGW